MKQLSTHKHVSQLVVYMSVSLVNLESGEGIWALVLSSFTLVPYIVMQELCMLSQES